MNKNHNFAAALAGLAGLTALGTLTGCVGYVEGPSRGGAYVPPPSVYVESAADYVYYPSYQVYYSSHTHQYVYPEGRAWVARPAPPHVSASVLFASPSVRLDFRDHPSTHHASVVQRYPRNWVPGPGQVRP